MVVKPLIRSGDVGLIVNVPVPLFLKPMYQPVDKPDTAGNVIVPAPLVQTKVAARLASLITGLDDEKSIGFCVVANLPLTVVRPAPCKEAASAADVPTPKVTLPQVPQTLALLVRYKY
jgi:hypothetical protein